MSDPLRVLVWFPFFGRATPSGPALNFQRLFPRGNYGDVVFSLVTTEGSHGLADYYDVHVLRGVHLRGYLAQLRTILALVLFLVRARKEFSVFYSLSSFTYGIVPALAARCLGIPSVIRSSATYDLAPINLIKWRLKRLLVRPINGIVAISSGIRDAAKRLGVPDDRILCLPNAVDLTRFKSNKTVNEEAKVPSLIYVGRIERAKGLSIILDALQVLNETSLNATLTFAGAWGSDLIFNEEVRTALVTRPYLNYVGTIQNVESVYAAGDIFVLPSQSEGMSNVLLEAMAMELCPIVSDIPAMTEIVINGLNGRVLDVSAADASIQLAEIIEETCISSNRYLEMGKAARQTIQSGFDADVMRKRMLDFLKRVVSA